MRYCRFIEKLSRIESIRKINSKMGTKRIAVCQMTSGPDKEVNLEVVSKLISNAMKDNVQMIFFPEACDFICDNKNDVLKLAELPHGDTVSSYQKLAAEHDVWLSMGGIHEKDSVNPKKIFNTHVIINNKGDIVQTYRKLHLFDVEIPEKNIRLKESDFTNPGGHIVTPVQTPVGNVGMAICYDMRFPELSTILSILNAQILTYPSAFTHATGVAHWHLLLRARAVENQCYVVAAAQVGQHNSKRRSYGHAVCVDPWGQVLLDCGDESPCYRVAEISHEKLSEVRQNMPVFQHRRRNVYSLYALSLRKDLIPEYSQSTSSLEQVKDRPDSTSGYVFGHVRVPETCVFYKSKLTYAFVNLRCVTPGHVLVAPIRPAERNLDLSDEEAEDFYKTIRLIQKLMERVHETTSCTMTIQDGPYSGQTVQHLHCHVMPRKKGDFIENDLIYLELSKHDQFAPGHPGKPARSLQEMETEAALLREAMSKIADENHILSR